MQLIDPRMNYLQVGIHVLVITFFWKQNKNVVLLLLTTCNTRNLSVFVFLDRIARLAK